MAFQFGSAVPADQISYGNAIQAPAPALALDATVPQASQALSAPPPQAQSGGLPDLPVSPFEVGLSMLFHGGTPGEAAQQVRAVKLRNLQEQIGLQQARQAYEAISQMSPAARLAIFLNGAKSGEMLGQREFQPHDLAGGHTLVNGPGGASVFGPVAGLVPGSNMPYAIGQGQDGTIGFHPLAGRQPGEVKAQDGIGFDTSTGDVRFRYAVPEKVGPGESLYPVMPGFSGPGAPAGGQGGGAPGGAGAAPGPQASAFLGKSGGLDPHAFFTKFWLPQEGGLNPADGNGAPTNMGINQTANPQVNVKTLSPQAAEQLFTTKYFNASGAANMPPALAMVHADTYGINPKMAGIFLQESRGDPNAYLAMREQWMQNAVQQHPGLAKYAQAWTNRNAALGQIIGQFGGSQQSEGGGVPTQIGPGIHGKTYQTFGSDDPRAKNLPQGASGTEAPTGEITPITGTFTTPDQVASIKKGLLDNDSVKDYLSAHDAYGAMIKAAAQPNGGMRAYALRDTFARTINPGAVARVGTIEAIKESQGVPANIKAYFMNLKGDGNVPPEVAQQILDISRGFLSSHYGTAHAINESYADFAHRHHIDPADITVPMDGEPPRMIVGPVPPPQQRQVGAVYATPKGPLVYMGGGKWRTY